MDKELLFKPRLPEDDVEVSGFGVMRVRALNRAEIIAIQAMDDMVAVDRKMISLGLVDPKLTEDEVGRWQEACPAKEIEPVSDRIAVLSGMRDGADKEAYKSLPDGS